MTREECSQMLTLLRTAYPGFYRNMKAEEGVRTLDLWTEMFSEEDCALTRLALRELISTHSGFPPDIAAVKEKLRAMKAAVLGEMSDEELWRILVKAASNGTYGAEEEFGQLPAVLQRYCGSPAALRDMARIDTETLNTVTHGQFLRQIRVAREREEFRERIPERLREALAGGGGIRRLRFPEGNEASRRAEIAAALDGTAARSGR